MPLLARPQHLLPLPGPLAHSAPASPYTCDDHTWRRWPKCARRPRRATPSSWRRAPHGRQRFLLCRTCKRLPLVCATLRRLSCPSGGPIEHQRASEGSAGAARPCRRAAPRLSPVGGPNPSPHSGRLQVSSESTPPSVRVATGPAGHRGRDQALSPAGPSPRSTQTMRWPGLPSARGPPMRPADASSHQGPFKADRRPPPPR